MKTYKIQVKKPWIGYSGPPIQTTYAEDVKRGFLLWNIESKNNFNVQFKSVTNKMPFVTIDWQGTIDDTFSVCKKFQNKSRFRIKSNVHLSQRDIHNLTSLLKNEKEATEVTFKIDRYVNKDVFTSGNVEFEKTDLRSASVLSQLLKDYCVSAGLSDSDSESEINEQIKAYISSVSQNEEIVRNIKWSLNRLEFDNTFGYGENNVIDFQKLSGIVGIFGPNRIGKSSIIGTILYALFNATDRGTIKNRDICNERKDYCLSKASVTANGVDYLIERQTLKHESKKGIVSAGTQLNVYKDSDGNLVDMCGEQRRDTEKIVQAIVGTSDDFLLTSAATQGEMTQYIRYNATPRRKILTKFLDLDVFDKLCDLANRDVNAVKAQLRNFPDKDWNALSSARQEDIEFFSRTIDDLSLKISDANVKLNELRAKFSLHSGVSLVTENDVKQQRLFVKQHDEVCKTHKSTIVEARQEIERLAEKIEKIELLKQEYDIDELKKKVSVHKKLEASLVSLKNIRDRHLATLKQQQKSLNLLADVPCGDAFPTCKFIKDAHSDKLKISEQQRAFDEASASVEEASTALLELDASDVEEKIVKLEKLRDVLSKTQLQLVKKTSVIKESEMKLVLAEEKLTLSQKKLDELSASLGTEENAEIILVRAEIDVLTKNIREWDAKKLDMASKKGHALSTIEQLKKEEISRNELLHKMKTFELISFAFSKKGIPSDIIKSQLPVINSEIARILDGIVDFTVELETDPMSDSTEVYISYGDNRRLIELGSGMEKMISSIAIRTALINVSSLPKTDMLIIDEGFDALDADGREACNKLLLSLKKNFRLILIISHLDGIKDIVDNVIEISKEDNDSRIVYE